MPDPDTVRSWVVNDTDGFFAIYQRAMQAQQLAAIDDCRRIADASGLDVTVGEDGKVRVNGELVRRAELRIKTRQWVAERVYEKVFGTRQPSTEVSVVVTTPDQYHKRMTELEREEKELLRGGR